MSLGEVSDLIREILGTDVEMGPDARLDADLQLESLDLLALDGRLRERHGDDVALCAHIAQLEFEAILALTVGDVAAYVAQARR
jgi:acyl carrier protein